MKTVILVSLMMSVLSACGSDKFTTVQGLQGNPGKDGSSCSVARVTDTTIAPNGGSLITCTDGTSSLVLNGAVGAAGSNAVFTPVKFCGADTSYPNTFTEIGYCIDNKLYGVYSLNGGFMAELPPGTYTSNGVNSSCTFTISANCAVSR